MDYPGSIVYPIPYIIYGGIHGMGFCISFRKNDRKMNPHSGFRSLMPCFLHFTLGMVVISMHLAILKSSFLISFVVVPTGDFARQVGSLHCSVWEIWFLILKGVYKCSTSSITQLSLIPRLFGYHFFDLRGTQSCFCHITGFDATYFIFVHSLIQSHFLRELKIII